MIPSRAQVSINIIQTVAAGADDHLKMQQKKATYYDTETALYLGQDRLDAAPRARRGSPGFDGGKRSGVRPRQMRPDARALCEDRLGGHTRDRWGCCVEGPFECTGSLHCPFAGPRGVTIKSPGSAPELDGSSDGDTAPSPGLRAWRYSTSYRGKRFNPIAISSTVGCSYPSATVPGACPQISSRILFSIPARDARVRNVCRQP
jgi:hypothetical protein